VTKYLIGMVGALAGMLIGGWLMLAPFALAYQSSGAEWADPTYTDFWSGLAILVISLIGLIMYVLGLFGELRRRGIIEPREEVPEAQAASMPVGGTQGGSGEIEQILLPLVTAMLKDMQDQQKREEDGAPQSSTPHGGTAPDQQQHDPERRTQR
jgi:hypothetical protein